MDKTYEVMDNFSVQRIVNRSFWIRLQPFDA